MILEYSSNSNVVYIYELQLLELTYQSRRHWISKKVSLPPKISPFIAQNIIKHFKFQILKKD